MWGHVGTVEPARQNGAQSLEHSQTLPHDMCVVGLSLALGQVNLEALARGRFGRNGVSRYWLEIRFLSRCVALGQLFRLSGPHSVWITGLTTRMGVS